MPFVAETKLVAKRVLANVLLVLAAASSPVSLSRTSAFSTSNTDRHRHRHPRQGLCPTSAFVLDHDHCHGYSCRYRPTSVSLGAGRERRFFSSDSNGEAKEQHQQQQHEQQQYYTQEQRKLIEMEESARQKRIGQMEQRFRKAVGREDRVLILEEKLARDSLLMTDAEKAELQGLLMARDNYEEQYDPQKFSLEHLEFKALHNDVFARLVRYCEEVQIAVTEMQPITEGKGDQIPIPTATATQFSSTRVFFLDGPDGGTASSLITKGGFCPTQLFVANRHESTVGALRQSGGGLLPEENVVLATSSEALTKGAFGGNCTKQGAFANLEFTGYYFDGCAGYYPHIVNMMSSALLVLDDDADHVGDMDSGGDDDSNSGDSRHLPKHPIVVGYSLLGGNKDVVDKELEVSRALTIIARSRGMKIVHALDDPARFGLPLGVTKLGGNTFTTWLVLEPEPK